MLLHDLEKGDEYLLARTTPIARNEKGGILAERIDALYRIKRTATEELMTCSLLWIDPPLNLYDKKTSMVRSVAIWGDDFTTLTWKGSGETCDFGD